MSTLVELGRGIESEKTETLLGWYDDLFLPIKAEQLSLLEIGIANGGSMRLWHEYFPNATVYGIDKSLDRCRAACAAGLNVHWIDQMDFDALRGFGHKAGPFDIIIDDASHLGAQSFITFNSLIPHLKPGGLYLVEDWGTGYWPHFPDGAEYQEGHTAGMVGFVKWLVDVVGRRESEKSGVFSVECRYGLVILRKAS